MGDASDYLSAAQLAEIRLAIKAFEGASVASVIQDGAAYDCARLLPDLVRHLDALTAPADGEALGRSLLAAVINGLSPTWAKLLSDLEDSAWERGALHIHAIGHAAGALSRERQGDTSTQGRSDCHVQALRRQRDNLTGGRECSQGNRHPMRCRAQGSTRDWHRLGQSAW